MQFNSLLLRIEKQLVRTKTMQHISIIDVSTGPLRLAFEICMAADATHKGPLIWLQLLFGEQCCRPIGNVCSASAGRVWPEATQTRYRSCQQLKWRGSVWVTADGSQHARRSHQNCFRMSTSDRSNSEVKSCCRVLRLKSAEGERADASESGGDFNFLAFNAFVSSTLQVDADDF